MEEKTRQNNEGQLSLKNKYKGSTSISAIGEGEANELLFRETGLHLDPQASEPHEAEMVDGTAISVSSRGNILVFDFFSVQQACLKTLKKRDFTILYSPNRE